MLFDEKFCRPDGIQRLVKELWDISQANAEIGVTEVTQQDCETLFTGLTSSRLYRLSCKGLEHAQLTVSGGN